MEAIVQAETSPVQVKDPFCSYMVSRRFILQNWSVHCKPVHNPQERV